MKYICSYFKIIYNTNNDFGRSKVFAVAIRIQHSPQFQD